MIESPYQLDRELGLLYYSVNELWGPLGASIRRPDGFVVIEEVSGRPCVEFRGVEGGDQLVYLMVKRGLDHFTAIREVSRVLGVRPIYMGVKDANAITYQLIRVPAGRGRATESWDGKGVSLRLMGTWRGRLDHTGNRFRIELDGADPLELSRRASRTAANGTLLAYYGYQRFGARRPNTHLVGRALLEGDARLAVDLLIGHPYPSEPEAHRRFRELYDAGNYEEALREAPRALRPERRALEELLRTNDPLRAIRAYQLPAQMFIDAYNSYLFNLCLSAAVAGGVELRGLTISVPPGSDEPWCAEELERRGLPATPSRPELLRRLGVRARRLRRQALMSVRGLSVSGNVVEFSLDRGMYATVVLRELLRQDPLTFAS